MMRKVMDRMVEGYVRLRVGLGGLVEDARGLQTLEWVALAIVILALLGAVAAIVGKQDSGVAQAVANAIQNFFERLLAWEWKSAK